MKGRIHTRIHDKGAVLELLGHEQWEGERLAGFREVFLNGARSQDELHLRVNRHLNAVALVVVDVEFQTKLGSAEARGKRMVAVFRAGNGHFKFQLSGKLVTQDGG